MASVNKVIIVGNLGQDPEIRTFPSGDQVANISVATTDRWKDKQSGEQREETTWHRVQFFGRLAEVVSQYLRKGSQVYVEGSIKYRKYTDKDGVERTSTEIRADQMQMLGARQDGGGRDDDRGGRGGYNDRSQGGDRGNYDRGGRNDNRGGGQQNGGRGGYSNDRGNDDRQRNDDRDDRQRGGGGGNGYSQQSRGGQDGGGRAPAPAPRAPAPPPAARGNATGGDSGFSDMDDDIPF